jgi:curved DNA-binding protein CbpA
MTPSPSERLADLKARAASMGQQDHYTFLSVSQDASADDILNAYRTFARNFHVDTFSRLDLSTDDHAAIDAFFARLNTARTALLDDAKRQEYNAVLRGEVAASDQVNIDDLSTLFEGEAAFRKGVALLNSGAFAPARDRFKVALAAHPDDSETQSHLAYATFMAEPLIADTQRTPAALNALSTLEALSTSHPDLQSAHHFLGKLLKLTHREPQAIKAFERVIALNSKHIDAQRELRLLKMRREQPTPSSSPSLLDKLKGFFKKT